MRAGATRAGSCFRTGFSFGSPHKQPWLEKQMKKIVVISKALNMFLPFGISFSLGL
jgi:hypothetical protein